MDYSDFFEELTGHPPFPYQKRLGAEEFPEVLDIPTGLGKTAGAVVAWMWKRMNEPGATPRRLVYCLPMRVLVEQTCEVVDGWLEEAADIFDAAGVPLPDAFTLMGGQREVEWVENPETPAVIIGTQDMLLSRALMRGYGMSRFQWPVHFGLLHNDAFWVFDETQLMGPAVETSAQIEGFRKALGTGAPAGSMWMSATVGGGQLDTVDHPRPDGGWATVELSERDRNHEIASRRLSARKTAGKSAAVVPNSTSKRKIGNYADALAEEITDAHVEDALTLVIANTVRRARAIYDSLAERDDRAAAVSLIHSRFRPHERNAREERLNAPGNRIVVATQVVEAGVDISARTLFTELAPWSSIVQRVGRCNRYGEVDDARVVWIDAEDGDKAAAPYDTEDLQTARKLLEEIDELGPTELETVDWRPPAEVRPVLRRKDLLELFDTTPDLSGRDIDVSPYIRDADDTDAFVYWRRWTGETPPQEISEPIDTELCRVGVWSKGGVNDFLAKKGVQGWRWRPLDGEWEPVDNVRPGQTVLLSVEDGGYSEETGWTGSKRDKPDPIAAPSSRAESTDDDTETDIGGWLGLSEHLSDVAEAVDELADRLGLEAEPRAALVEAARWHDVGKAHPVFQRRLLEPVREAEDLEPPTGDGPWAKSNHRRGRYERPHFRHELASALAFLGSDGGLREREALVAYLIAAHHGKIRLSIRSLPGEDEPAEPDPLFARGVWDGDEIPPVDVPGLGSVGPFELDLRPMKLGEGSWMERTLAIRDDPQLGPFRLGWLEALLRIGDWRASARERERHAAAETTRRQRSADDIHEMAGEVQ